MHIDLNSCFATIEQQANPFWRGKPLAVAAYDSPRGCIVAASVEAKKLGIGVGMRVMDGKAIYPNLVVTTPDSDKYRSVHKQLLKILENYDPSPLAKSIDEFVIKPVVGEIVSVGKEIKQRLKEEIGEWMRASVGISTNKFLAKMASGQVKPDGLTVIDKTNFLQYYLGWGLTDIKGIKTANMVRLNNLGIFTTVDFYQAEIWRLKAAFESIVGYYWYLRLRGLEPDEQAWGRKSFGNSFALPKPYFAMVDLSPILMKLVEKMAFRLRKSGFVTKGIHVAILYRDGNFWHMGRKLFEETFDSRVLYKKALKLLSGSGLMKPVHTLSVACFDLVVKSNIQLSFLEDWAKAERFIKAIDDINETWGDWVVYPAQMMGISDYVKDRIGFGNTGL